MTAVNTTLLTTVKDAFTLFTMTRETAMTIAVGVKVRHDLTGLEAQVHRIFSGKLYLSLWSHDGAYVTDWFDKRHWRPIAE